MPTVDDESAEEWSENAWDTSPLLALREVGYSHEMEEAAVLGDAFLMSRPPSRLEQTPPPPWLLKLLVTSGEEFLREPPLEVGVEAVGEGGGAEPRRTAVAAVAAEEGSRELEDGVGIIGAETDKQPPKAPATQAGATSHRQHQRLNFQVSTSGTCCFDSARALDLSPGRPGTHAELLQLTGREGRGVARRTGSTAERARRKEGAIAKSFQPPSPGYPGRLYNLRAVCSTRQ
ncbi:unnamed protein product [Sphagnum tenellum]